MLLKGIKIVKGLKKVYKLKKYHSKHYKEKPKSRKKIGEKLMDESKADVIGILRHKGVVGKRFMQQAGMYRQLEI